MGFNKIVKLLISVIICELAGVLGAVFTGAEIAGWYQRLNKPFFNPPGWIFGPVWTVLFLLMGISLYLVMEKDFKVSNRIGNSGLKAWNKWSENFWSGPWQKINIVLVFIVQLLLNIFWSIIFFGAHNPGLAFFELLMLLAAIIYTTVNFYRVSKVAAYMLVPYILWVTFAGLLNLVIWLIN
jgi:tryptophan-rich sensory protein